MTREEAIWQIENRWDIMDYGESKALGEALDMAIEALSERPKGEWIRDGQFWKCSNCGARIFSETDADREIHHAFCGVCGADMRRGIQNEDNT